MKLSIEDRNSSAMEDYYEMNTTRPKRFVVIEWHTANCGGNKTVRRADVLTEAAIIARKPSVCEVYIVDSFWGWKREAA